MASYYRLITITKGEKKDAQTVSFKLRKDSSSRDIETAVRSRFRIPETEALVLTDSDGCDVILDSQLITGKYKLHATTIPVSPPQFVDAGAEGQESFFHAAQQGVVSGVEYYLSQGGDPNVVDKEGKTALDHATACGQVEVVRLLLQKGAKGTSTSQRYNVEKKSPSYEVVKRELYYFPIRGRAEPIRLLLSLVGLPFDDVSITDWVKLKPTLPFGQLPVLREHLPDKTVWEIPESLAIMRHLARISNLYGNSEKEATQADFLADKTAAFRNEQINVAWAYAPHFNRGPTATANRTHFFASTLPPFLNLLTKYIQPARGPFLVSSSLTYTDLIVFDTLDLVSHVRPDSLASHPLLTKFMDAVLSDKRLSPYLEKRRQPDLARAT